jgi:hypothetical protein
LGPWLLLLLLLLSRGDGAQDSGPHVVGEPAFKAINTSHLEVSFHMSNIDISAIMNMSLLIEIKMRNKNEIKKQIKGTLVKHPYPGEPFIIMASLKPCSSYNYFIHAEIAQLFMTTFESKRFKYRNTTCDDSTQQRSATPVMASLLARHKWYVVVGAGGVLLAILALIGWQQHQRLAACCKGEVYVKLERRAPDEEAVALVQLECKNKTAILDSS